MAFCIYCGKKMLEINIEFPVCTLCGGACSVCNRASFTDRIPLFCHICGADALVSYENPLCEKCKKRF